MEKRYTKTMAVVISSIVFVFVISGFIGCKGKETKTLEITDKTLHQIGRFESTSEGNILKADKGQSGYLIFGPYWPLKKGMYRVKFNLMGTGEPDQEVARLDVNIMDTTTKRPLTSPIERRIITTDKTGWQEYEIFFQAEDNEKGNLVYEFRVYANGAGEVKVRRITLERL